MLSFALSLIDSASDREFMKELYLRHESLMLHIALKIVGDRNTAEDMVQEAAVRLIDKADMLRTRTPEQAAGYVAQTVRSVSINHYNKTQRQGKRLFYGAGDDLAEDLPANEPIPELGYIRQETYKMLGAAIMMLSDRDRDLIMNKYLLDYSNEQICSEMGIKRTSLLPLLSRARRRARKICKELMADAEG